MWQRLAVCTAGAFWSPSVLFRNKQNTEQSAYCRGPLNVHRWCLSAQECCCSIHLRPLCAPVHLDSHHLHPQNVSPLQTHWRMLMLFIQFLKGILLSFEKLKTTWLYVTLQFNFVWMIPLLFRHERFSTWSEIGWGLRIWTNIYLMSL